MTASGSLVARIASGAPDKGIGITRAYENLVLFYLTSLLFLYPYGLPLAQGASLRAPDLLGMICLLFGATSIALKERIRVDLLFLAIAGPFVLLELATPVIGAVGYRRPLDAVSTLRMAILWLPMMFLVMLAIPFAALRFSRKFRLLLAASLCLNLPYAVIQIAVDFGYAPPWLAFTRLLEPWAVDRHFDVVVGLRPAGFFVNTTALSVFGIVCLSYFYARHISDRRRADLYLTLGSLFLILLTTSRVAFAASAVILALGWFALTGWRKLALLAILVAGAAAIAVVIDSTIGLEQVFHRFTRLAESGLLADVSFGHRVRDTWPSALDIARDYPVGTLVSAPRVALLIDSGYLNYYIQGRWLFIAAIVLMLAGQWLIGLRSIKDRGSRSGGLMILFVTVYVTLALVITNPTRSPLTIAFLVFAYWLLRVERRSQWVPASRLTEKSS